MLTLQKRPISCQDIYIYMYDDQFLFCKRHTSYSTYDDKQYKNKYIGKIDHQITVICIALLCTCITIKILRSSIK